MNIRYLLEKEEHSRGLYGIEKIGRFNTVFVRMRFLAFDYFRLNHFKSTTKLWH